MERNDRSLWILLVVLVLVVLFGQLLGGRMWMGMMDGRWLGATGLPLGRVAFVGWLGMLAFWGALFVGGILLTRSINGPSRGARFETPLDIAKRRYASGELTAEEFERLREALER